MTSDWISKIDLRWIVTDHLGTLRDDRTKAISGKDLTVFYGVPLLATAVLTSFDVRLSDGAIGVLTNALAILGGLLFNLLVLLQGLSWPEEHPLAKSARKLAEEIYSNIAYSILVSLIALLPLIVAANYASDRPGRLIAGAPAIWLVLHFGLTMCMVLKRMHEMLEEQFSSRAKAKK